MKKLLLTLLLFPGIALAEQYPNTHCVSVTPTIATAAYTSGDFMGAAVMSFTGALKGTTNAGYVTSVMVTDLAAQAVDLDVVIFSDNPSGTTFTDEAALDIADSDLTKVAGVVNLGSSTRFAFNDNSVHYLANQSIPVVGGRVAGSPSTTVYGALVARGAYDGASASDLTVTLCFSQD